MSPQRQIDALVARFCADLATLVRAVAAEEIERATAASAPSVAARPKPRRSTRAVPAPPELQPAPPASTSTEQTAAPPLDLAERLRVFVAMHAAYSARELADALGVRTVDVIEPLRVLVDASSVHKRIESGQARYYSEAPLDDEDDNDTTTPAPVVVLRSGVILRRTPQPP